MRAPVHRVLFKDLAAALFSPLGTEPQIKYIDMPEGLEKKYRSYTCAQSEKLRAVGFEDKFFTLEAAVNDYVTNYLEKDERGAMEAGT